MHDVLKNGWVGIRSYTATLQAVVSCPDPTLSWGKWSGDYWVISWLWESAV